MADVISLPVEVDTRKAQAQLKGLTASVIGLNQAFELVGKAARALQSVFGSTVNNAIKLESSVAEISTLLGDQAGATQRLTKEILSLQATYGASQQELAKGYYNAISSGAVDATTAIKLMATANKLAAGGVTTLDVAIDGLTNIINAYGLKADDAVEVSDALFLGMKAGKTTVAELSSNLGKAASFANVAGLSFQELIAATSAITTGGISTSEAVTQVNGAMIALSRQTPDLTKVLKSLGIESVQAAVKQKGFVNVLKEIIGETDGTTEELVKLFGSMEAVKSIVALTSDSIGGKFNQIMDEMGKASEENGKTTEDAFNKIAQTTGYQLKVIEGEVDATFTQIGDQLKGFQLDFYKFFLTTLREGQRIFIAFGKTIEKVDFESLAKPMLQFGASLALVFGATSFTKIITNIRALNAALLITSVQSIAMGAGFIGAVVAIDKLIANFKELKKVASDTWGVIKNYLLKGLSKIGPADPFAPMEERIKAAKKELIKFDAEIDKSKEKLKKTTDEFEVQDGIVETLYKTFKETFATFQIELDKSTLGVQKLNDELDDTERERKAKIKVDVEEKRDTKGFFDSIFKYAEEGFQLVISGIESALPDVVVNFFDENSEKITKAFLGAAQAFLNSVSSGSKKTRSLLNQEKDLDKKIAQAKAANEIEEYNKLIEEKKALDLEYAQVQREAAGEFVSTAGGAIADAFAPGAGAFVSTLLDILQDKEAFKAFIDGFAEAIPDIIITIIENIPYIAFKLAEAIVKAIVLLVERVFQELWIRLTTGIQLAVDGFIGGLINAAPRFISELVEQVKKGLGIGGGDGGTLGQIKSRIGDLKGGIKFSSGGIIPNGFPNDTYGPVMVESGEEIVSSSDRSKIKDDIAMLGAMIASSQGGAQNIKVDVVLDKKVLASTILNLNRNNNRLTA